MAKLRSILGYTGAVLTLALMALVPFLLYGWFTKTIGSAGLRIHPTYSGGEVARVIEREGYRIVVNRPVLRQTPLQRIDPFVQLTWTPAARLPASVSDAVDLDGDGRPDLRVSFAPARLDVAVEPLGGRYQAMHWRGIRSFSELIARVNDTIVVRVPVH